MLAAIGSVCSSNSFIIYHHHLDGPSISSSTFKNPSFSINFRSAKRTALVSRNPTCTAKLAPSSSGSGSSVDQEDPKAADDDACQLKRFADWRAARTYKESGVIFDGKIEGFNNGGLLIRFYSLLGFLPYPLLSPSYSCKDPQKAIQDIAKDLVGSSISVKVVDASEEDKKLIFSEKDAVWSKYSNQVKVGDIFDATVGSVEDYGAFVHLQFPDGRYYLTGLVHVSEVSWDLVQDVRDFLKEGNQVKVKVVYIDR